ncbi:MAG TPA: TlpA disulfide reductase family protein [Candidatus Limnocylindrales bacterium]|nr:TlpA disulfide reductase family protein [Candidatus Limnocylindrales bacterium]
MVSSLVLVLAGCSTGSAVAKPGDPAPPISGPTIDGAQFDLASLRGRPVIVNFWASGCVPCREEFPLLVAAERAHAADGLAVVGVIFNDDAASARTFAASMGATWPSLVDPNRTLASAYRVVAPPQSYFIDRNGVLRSMQIGEMLQVDLDRQLPGILGR